MNDDAYLKHLGELIETYTRLFAGCLRRALEAAVESDRISEEDAHVIFEATGTELTASMERVEALRQEPAPAQPQLLLPAPTPLITMHHPEDHDHHRIP
jgi:hypothetical protein